MSVKKNTDGGKPVTETKPPRPAGTAANKPPAKTESKPASAPKRDAASRSTPAKPVEKEEAARPPAASKPEPEPVSKQPKQEAVAAPPAPVEPEPQPEPQPQPQPQPQPLPPLAEDHQVDAILRADHGDPFGFLGMHQLAPGVLVVRAFLPQASRVAVIDSASAKAVADLQRLRDEGMFAGIVDGRKKAFPYRLRVTTEGGAKDLEDPYRFPPVLSEKDAHLLAQGDHLASYEKLGAHPITVDGVDGVAFAVWAPNARRVSVIGEFNGWDGRRHPMRLRHDCGVWEIFLPGATAGQLYKYTLKSEMSTRLIDKADPYAFLVEPSPGSASIIYDLNAYRWGDGKWARSRRNANSREAPISIYEVHLGSWRRNPKEGNRWLSYDELADDLVDYVADIGFTHIELLPISEFDFDGSLGFQPFALFAPTSRYGDPDGFRLLVDRCHRAGIGVIADWVPYHFSDDPHGLRTFDGSHLYEHPDPQQRRHPGWNTLTYDYGRREVGNYLLSNALFWLEQYHLDGLRLGSLAAMLYLDYGRSRGEWTPNRFGGPENLEAVDLLRRLNEVVYARHPDGLTIAEEASGWPRVSHPTFLGGLGFGLKWNPAWVRDTLRYMSRNPVHRKYYHDELTHGLVSAFQESFVLPLSHQEVSYGRGSLLQKMPGDRWQRFANLRVYYALVYTHPGKKLMFMGNEFAQEREWNSDASLDWHLLDDAMHKGIQSLVRDLNRLYREIPALHELDCEDDGFSWIDASDNDQSIISFIRQGKERDEFAVVVCNFTPVVRNDYRIGVPVAGVYRERLNTDAEKYGGTNVGNLGSATAIEESMHGRPFSLSLNIPPFAAVILSHTPE